MFGQIPGLNTLGISLARLDNAPYGGLNPPHTHPRATEILLVLEGTLYVGFVTSNQDTRLIMKVLYPGDVFVFPNPVAIAISNAVFGSEGPINPDVLVKAFHLNKNVIFNLQSRFRWNNN
ncbi:hypothetical protein PTKIN_Ptkin01aG0366900 [Pterospermum kingtungense]